MKRALLTYRTGNIGDDVQSLALAQPHFLGEPDMWVDRDQFQDYEGGEPVELVANGFFLCKNREGILAFPPPKNFHVRYVALCASNIPDTPEAREHLMNSAPIGCRDQHTVKWCEDRGIPNYYASCPSCLLGRGLGEEPDESASEYNPDGPIVLVDVNPKRLPPFGVSDREVIVLTNRVHPAWYPSVEMRFKALRKKLRVLRGASLVVTNRLHVAMPCIGMGVPVVMVEADSLAFRLTALPTWLKVHKKEKLRHVTLDPAAHRTSEFLENRATWVETVANKVLARVSGLDL